MARDLIGEENFVEVYVNTPIEVCESRDAKGLYKLARAGRIPNMTGVGSLYEAPITPDYVADGAKIEIPTTVLAITKILTQT